MKIEVKCFGELGLFLPDGGMIDVPFKTQVKDLPEVLGFEACKVAMYFVGEDRVSPAYVLSDGDVLKIFPPITGG